MFGRKPCLPIDILFATNTAQLKGNTRIKYVENLKWRIEWAYKAAIPVQKVCPFLRGLGQRRRHLGRVRPM